MQETKLGMVWETFTQKWYAWLFKRHISSFWFRKLGSSCSCYKSTHSQKQNLFSLGNTCHYWQFQKVSIELLTNGSYNHTFLCGWNCRPEAVLWTSNKTADQRQVYGHFSVYRAIFSTFFTKLLTMAVLWTLFGVLRYLTCGHVAKTADHGSSMDSFRPSSANCWPMAGLWTLFGPLKSCQQNCWP